MAWNISRIRASETGLSTTTTSSGLFEDARIRPQVPSSAVTRTPLTVTTSRIFCPVISSPAAAMASIRFTARTTTSYLISSSQCGDIVGEPQVFGTSR